LIIHETGTAVSQALAIGQSAGLERETSTRFSSPELEWQVRLPVQAKFAAASFVAALEEGF
jgi:hypothetical protein